MTDAIVNLGKLSKPATVLVEKISDAVGGVFRPYQVVRIAKAEAEAEIIRASAQIEVQELQRRALQRFLVEEGAKQENMEAITAKALPQLTSGASPENVEKDWIANFFDKCRLISDGEMQDLWSRVLAGEASVPGTFSKRTVDFIGSLDRGDAQLFTSLCTFCWTLGDDLVPPIFDMGHSIYLDAEINFSTLSHLDSIGLIRFDDVNGFRRVKIPKQFRVYYYDRHLDLQFVKDSGNELSTGKVLMTKLGAELAPICSSKPNDAFFDYVAGRWSVLLPKASETSPANDSGEGSS